MPHPHRGGRARPSAGHAQAPTIIRQTLTGAATGTMPRDVMTLGGRPECAAPFPDGVANGGCCQAQPRALLRWDVRVHQCAGNPP
jgi:hypothetical protein